MRGEGSKPFKVEKKASVAVPAGATKRAKALRSGYPDPLSKRSVGGVRNDDEVTQAVRRTARRERFKEWWGANECLATEGGDKISDYNEMPARPSPLSHRLTAGLCGVAEVSVSYAASRLQHLVGRPVV